MSQYIQFVADRILIDIDLDPIFNTINPFTFMANLGLADKANFFESKETTYQKPTMGTIYDSDDDDF